MLNKRFVSECQQFPDIYFSQVSVLMHLKCDGIFNDHFITQSLLSPRVKIFENLSTFVEIMGN